MLRLTPTYNSVPFFPFTIEVDDSFLNALSRVIRSSGGDCTVWRGVVRVKLSMKKDILGNEILI